MRASANVNGVNSTFVHDGFSCVQQTINGGASTEYFVPGSKPLFEYTGANRFAYTEDGRGNVTGLYDGANYAARFKYDAFGNVKTYNSNNQLMDNTSGPRFGGQFYDSATDQVYLRNRYYSAGTGRFNVMDPMGTRGGLNLFGYCGGNPANYTDPWGLDDDNPQTTQVNPNPNPKPINIYEGEGFLFYPMHKFAELLAWSPFGRSPSSGGGTSPGGPGFVGAGGIKGANMAPSDVARLVHDEVNPVVKTEMILVTLPASVETAAPAIGAGVSLVRAIIKGEDPIDATTSGAMAGIAGGPLFGGKWAGFGLSGRTLLLSKFTLGTTGSFFAFRSADQSFERGEYGAALFDATLGTVSAWETGGTARSILDEFPGLNPGNYRLSSNGFGANFANAKIEFLNPNTSGLRVVGRPGMDYEIVKDVKGRSVRIYGQAGSSSTTLGHDETILETARALAKSGEYEYLTTQRSWRTATGRVGTSRRIPDIIGVRRNGVVDGLEILSQSDLPKILENRLDEGRSTLPDWRQGDIFVIKPGEH